MADIVFPCPACRQNISCDEQWAGQQLQCPLCHQNITMPKGGGAGKPDSPLVPKPPAEGRLALNQNAQKPATTGNKNIPIRNLAGPVQKKEAKWKMYAQGAVIILFVAAAAWFGWPYAKKMFQSEEQVAAEAAAAAAAAKTSPDPAGGGAQPGAANTEGSAAAPTPDMPAEPGQPAPGAAPGIETAPEGVNTNITVAQKGPAIPPTHTTEVNAARIPSGRVNGRLANNEFLPEIVRIDQVGNSQLLRFIQGELTAPERELDIYLRFKQGEKLSGQKLSISSDTRTGGLPQVIKRWKTNPRYAPTTKSFSSGYALRLELGEHKNGLIKGKLYVSLPDNEKSVVGGNFTAVTTIPAAGIPAPSAAAAPAQGGQMPGAPGMPGMPGAGAEYGGRYGR